MRRRCQLSAGRRRSCFLCKDTRIEAIFRRVVTLDAWDSRRFEATEADREFIELCSIQPSVDELEKDSDIRR